MQQMMKEWDTKDPTMAAYCAPICQLKEHFNRLELHHIRQTDNEAADSLAQVSSTRQRILPGVFLPQLHQPSVKIKAATDLAEAESQAPRDPDLA